MGRRLIRHLVSAGVGITAAPCVAFLFLDGIRRTAFLSVTVQTNQLPGLPPGARLGVPMHSAWLPAVELVAAAALAGALAGARSISPVAPLIAAVPLLAIHFYGHSGLAAADGLVQATWHLAFASEFLLVMIGGAIVIGLLAATRWLSPVAALIAGAPLLAGGLFTLLTPTTAQGVIVRIVYGRLWQPATETLAASGWLVLLGGMLLVAGMMPSRWRRDGGQGIAEPIAVAPTLAQAGTQCAVRR